MTASRVQAKLRTRGIADAVLGVAAGRRTALPLVLGIALALAAHVGVGLLAWYGMPSSALPASHLPDTEIELPANTQPSEPLPPQVRTDIPLPSERSIHHSRTLHEPPAPAPQKPSSPAQAGTVVAQASDPNQPLDFSADVFVTGSASAYAGGSTAARGTSHSAVTAAALGARDQGPGKPGLAAAVTLVSDEWQCGWPHEADRAEVDEQTVTMRVLVGPDGHAQRVTVIDDPGYGFADAARSCAMDTHFVPARDERGQPVLALSPQIRVRFTR